MGARAYAAAHLRLCWRVKDVTNKSGSMQSSPTTVLSSRMAVPRRPDDDHHAAAPAKRMLTQHHHANTVTATSRSEWVDASYPPRFERANTCSRMPTVWERKQRELLIGATRDNPSSPNHQQLLRGIQASIYPPTSPYKSLAHLLPLAIQANSTWVIRQLTARLFVYAPRDTVFLLARHVRDAVQQHNHIMTRLLVWAIEFESYATKIDPSPDRTLCFAIRHARLLGLDVVRDMVNMLPLRRCEINLAFSAAVAQDRMPMMQCLCGVLSIENVRPIAWTLLSRRRNYSNTEKKRVMLRYIQCRACVCMAACCM